MLLEPVGKRMELRTIDNVVDEVHGTRSGYIIGLGYGIKPDKQTQM